MTAAAIQLQQVHATPTPAAASYDVFSRDSHACCAKLDSESVEVFKDDDSQTEVTVSWSNGTYALLHVLIYDLTTALTNALFLKDAEQTLVSSTCRDSASLSQRLDAIGNARLKIISIPSKFSYGRLCISTSSMQSLLRRYDISSDFASVLLAFSEPPRVSEQGYECFAQDTQQDGSYSLSYLYRFIERDDPESDWKFRQIGVYCAYSAVTNTCLYVFLQPHTASKFDGRLAMLRSRRDSTATLLADPFRLHEVLIGTYFDNWRWYLRGMADIFKEDSDEVFTADIHPPKHLPPSQGLSQGLNLNFDKLQSWRDLSDRIMPLGALFDATLRTLDALHKIGQHATPTPPGREAFFVTHRSLLLGIKSSVEVLQNRIKGVIDLLADTLNLKNQDESALLNHHLYNLTRDTVDDSTTVRVITFVTLIYLPAAFVASVFGMNLFVFDQATHRIQVSREFWIYVATFVPLTMLTLGIWFFLSRSARQRRERREKVLHMAHIAVQQSAQL